MTEETENGGFTLSLNAIPRDGGTPGMVDNRTNCIAASIRRNYIASFEDIINMDESEMDNEILDGVLDGNRIDYDIIESALTEESSSVIGARNDNLRSIAQSIRLHNSLTWLDEEEEEIEEGVDDGNLKQFLEHPTTCELSPDLHDSLVHYVTETSDTIRGWADALGGDKIERIQSEYAVNEQSLLKAKVQSERVIRSEHGLKVRTLLKEKAESARDFNDAALGTLELCNRQNSISQSIDTRKKSNFEKKPRGKRPLLVSIIMSRKFMLFRQRYANAQMNRTLYFPSLPQPFSDDDLDEAGITEMTRSRASHRFIITADTQFGILMDGFEMGYPTWQNEIDISRDCVKEINAMKGDERPLYVCVCGDLIDTEGSFINALASWKQVMKGWERKVIAQQQMKDFKDVWSHLEEDIGLICLCGNHDVGNRPTAQSIQTWTSAFGSDYLAFWVNGTYNIGLNNCIFSDPSGAYELYEEQLAWLEKRLEYASAKKASQIFVYSHFPWFITHEDEEDIHMTSASLPPTGWGPEGTQFADSYFNIPIERRKLVLDLFRKHKVKACFSGHFHQNVVSKTEWGMDMIITGPLSMMLKSTGNLSLIEEKQTCGMRIVDVHENSFEHQFIPLKFTYCPDCRETKPTDDELKSSKSISNKDDERKRDCMKTIQE